MLVFNHLFDGAIDPISNEFVASSELTLVPCTENFLQQAVPSVTAQFLVYNEFEQRFSTSRLVRCLLDTPISRIDTSQSTARSSARRLRARWLVRPASPASVVA